MEQECHYARRQKAGQGQEWERIYQRVERKRFGMEVSRRKRGRRWAQKEDEAMRERRQYQGAITFNYIIRERQRYYGRLKLRMKI